MKKLRYVTTLAAALIFSATAASALKYPIVGGAAMYPSRNILQNVVHSRAHTTLAAAVEAADFVKTLESPGPFTVFALTNKAFGSLPAGTLHNLLKPENKARLTAILEYHVVPGCIAPKDLKKIIRKGHGVTPAENRPGGRLQLQTDLR